jgi:ATP-dependent DNA helicase RecQ
VHFGETPKWSTCNGCDVCSGEPSWFGASPIKRKAAESKVANVKRKVTVQPAPQTTGAVSRPAPIQDDRLRERLREWRRGISSELGMPAFIVMHDTTLDELCKVRPSTLAELRGVSGFGDRKVEKYGTQILETLKNFGSKPRGAGAG